MTYLQQVQNELIADAIRAITGNFTGYSLKLDPRIDQNDDGTRIFAWPGS